VPPRKHKDLVPKAAELLKRDASLIRDCVDFYWKEIRVTTSALKAPSIGINGFGTFHFRLAKSKEKLHIYKMALAKYLKKEDTFRNHAIVKMLKERIENIEACIVMKEEEMEKFKRIAKEKEDDKLKKSMGQ
jgi:hypothetical protein